MTQVIKLKLVKEAEDLSEVDCLEHIHKDIQKLEALKHGMDVQEVTLTRLFQHVKMMQDEQLLLAQLQLECREAEEKINTALTEKGGRRARKLRLSS